MRYRLLLVLAVAAIAGCASETKAPTPTEPPQGGSGQPLNRADTTVLHVAPAPR